MVIDCHVHLLPPRRLAGLLTWMHDFYPHHPIPVDVTLDQCIADYDVLDVDYLFNLVYPIRGTETEEVNRTRGSFPSAACIPPMTTRARSWTGVSASTAFSDSRSIHSSSASTRLTRG